MTIAPCPVYLFKTEKAGLPKDDRQIIMPNVLDRQFATARSNQKWVADFTFYGRPRAGYIYLPSLNRTGFAGGHLV